MPAKLAAYLMRGIVRPDTDEIHLGVYPGWDYTWTYMHEVTYPAAADAIAVGSLGFANTAAGQAFLTSLATSWTMANFTGPNGTFYAVAWRASDGLVLSAYEIGGAVGRELSALNMIRLFDTALSDGRATFLGPLLDTKTGGAPSGNTKRGELLFIGGFIQWTTIEWAVLLLDNTWNATGSDAVSRNIAVLTDIPVGAWVMPPAALTGKVVSESGGAFANNVSFPPQPAGRTIRHAAIYVNTGNPATSEVARIISADLAGAPLITNGVNPLWLDFLGRPVLYFGVGLEPGRVATSGPIVPSG